MEGLTTTVKTHVEEEKKLNEKRKDKKAKGKEEGGEG